MFWWAVCPLYSVVMSAVNMLLTQSCPPHTLRQRKNPVTAGPSVDENVSWICKPKTDFIISHKFQNWKSFINVHIRKSSQNVKNRSYISRQEKVFHESLNMEKKVSRISKNRVNKIIIHAQISHNSWPSCRNWESRSNAITTHLIDTVTFLCVSTVVTVVSKSSLAGIEITTRIHQNVQKRSSWINYGC